MKNSLSYQSYKKSPYRCVKLTTYFDVYDDLFAQYRGKEITFVEIGVLFGGSLFMWRDFFGPKARIIGVDLNPNAKKWEEEGFEIYIGSQSDENFWNRFVEEITSVDVVLDDGGHTYEQQIVTTEMLLNKINDGGMLVVEDTHTSYMRDFGPHKFSFIEYTKVMMDKINCRCGILENRKAESRVWSLRVYESIVAFLVNSDATELKSEPIDNNGIVDQASDFRHNDNKSVLAIESLFKRFNALKYIPGFMWVNRRLLSYHKNRKFKSKRFFQS